MSPKTKIPAFNTTDARFTPILNNVTINYSGIFTDAFGNYNYTLTAPSSAATYTIKVNSTWDNTIPGEALTTLDVKNTPTTRTGGISAFIIQNSTGRVVAYVKNQQY